MNRLQAQNMIDVRVSEEYIPHFQFIFFNKILQKSGFLSGKITRIDDERIVVVVINHIRILRKRIESK